MQLLIGKKALGRALHKDAVTRLGALGHLERLHTSRLLTAGTQEHCLRLDAAHFRRLQVAQEEAERAVQSLARHQLGQTADHCPWSRFPKVHLLDEESGGVRMLKGRFLLR